MHRLCKVEEEAAEAEAEAEACAYSCQEQFRLTIHAFPAWQTSEIRQQRSDIRHTYIQTDIHQAHAPRTHTRTRTHALGRGKILDPRLDINQRGCPSQPGMNDSVTDGQRSSLGLREFG
jgi:hypothetical protein